ncbi:MAG: hypothetical protein OEY14_05520 [Myxococcales bacterium]|nr:hypothetical protein [Myxococcales bacterium]
MGAMLDRMPAPRAGSSFREAGDASRPKPGTDFGSGVPVPLLRALGVLGVLGVLGALASLSLLACGSPVYGPAPPSPAEPAEPASVSPSAAEVPAPAGTGAGPIAIEAGPEAGAISSPAPSAGAQAEPSLALDLRSAPEWARGFDRGATTASAAHRSSVPQLRDPAAVFLDLGTLRAPELVALLVCRFDVLGERAWDARGVLGVNVAPDVTLRVQVGEGPEARIRGPEDGRSFFASVPHLSLRAGDTLHFVAADRDLAHDDPMGRASARYEGSFPLQARSDSFVIECRAAEPAWAATQAAPRLGEADAALSHLERAVRPDPDGFRTELPSDQTAPVRVALYRAASLLGWSHPEIAARLQRFERYEAEWRRRISEILDAKLRQLPAPGTAARLSAQLPSVAFVQTRCEPAPQGRGAQAQGRCFFTFEAVYRLPRGRRSVPHLRASLLFPDGRREELMSSSRTRDGVALPNAVVVRESGPMGIEMRIDADLSALEERARPRLLLIQHSGDRVLLRLE